MGRCRNTFMQVCCKMTVRQGVCVCVLAGDKGLTSHEPQTMPYKHSLSQWEVCIICQFLSHEGASCCPEEREA